MRKFKSRYKKTQFNQKVLFCTRFIHGFQVVERRKQIEIEEQEIRRKEKELMSTVKLPAESEAYKVQTIAEGKRSVYKSTKKVRERVRASKSLRSKCFLILLKPASHGINLKLCFPKLSTWFQIDIGDCFLFTLQWLF